MPGGQKYALVERERRFLVAELPASEPVATRRIEDVYVTGTRIRLRRSEGTVDGHHEVVRKLTQKIAEPGGPDEAVARPGDVRAPRHPRRARPGP